MISQFGVKNEVKTTLLTCPICQMDFPTTIRIDEHFIKDHPGIKPYHCSVCNARFTKKKSLRIHVYSGQLGCVILKKIFKNQDCKTYLNLTYLISFLKILEIISRLCRIPRIFKECSRTFKNNTKFNNVHKF